MGPRRRRDERERIDALYAGGVWWAPAPHKSDPAYRPWLIVNDDSHPFAETECIVLGLTTQQHAEGIPIPDDAWILGGSQTEAYISPWYVTTIKQRDFDTQQGELGESIVRDAIDHLHEYTAFIDN